MKPAGKKAHIYKVATQLSRMVDREGGILRDVAIARAAANVEAMRDEFMDVLQGLIEQLALVAGDASLPPMHRLGVLEQQANQIITLAGTYALSDLQEAAMRLCDLTAALTARQEVIEGAVMVHVNAIRLFSPRNKAGDPAAAAKILADLRKVSKHFGIAAAMDAPSA